MQRLQLHRADGIKGVGIGALVVGAIYLASGTYGFVKTNACKNALAAQRACADGDKEMCDRLTPTANVRSRADRGRAVRAASISAASISHTILAGTLQGGGRKECGGNSTSKAPDNHSRDARRKAERKSRYRRTASIQSRLVEACALGRGVWLVLMGRPCGSCAAMCRVSSVVAFGAAASMSATNSAILQLRSRAVSADQQGSGASSSFSISLGQSSENRSTLTFSSNSISQRLVQLRHRCTEPLPPSRRAWVQLSPGHC